jgi:hypothetical protein
MAIDIRDIISHISGEINEFTSKVQIYFKSLTQYEMIAWGVFGVGFIMMIVAFIMW